MAQRVGRPWGPIRAESSEAQALAAFLRAQIDASGKTLAVLAKEIHISKSRISEQIGGKVPDRDFVTALIRATIPEPRLCERRLAEAARLLQAARRPAPTAAPQPSADLTVELAELRTRQIETLDRLTRSLEQNNQLREAADKSAKLVMVLLTMINKLERRITDLTGEREQLRAAQADSQTLHDTQRQLSRAQEQEQRAQQELIRAQEKQRQAEELAAAVQAKVDRLTDELDRLRGTTPDDAAGEDTHFTEQPAVSTDPVGDDIDQALERITAVNDQDDQILQTITQDLITDPPPQSVVPYNPADNYLTTTFASYNLDALKQAAETAAEKGDYRRAVEMYDDVAIRHTRILGPEHPDTLVVRSDLLWWRAQAGDVEGASAALAELLPVFERVMGPEHPGTAAVRTYLALCWKDAGDVEGASAALAEVLPVFERMRGPEHPDTLTLRRGLARWRRQTGDVEGAAAALAELLPVHERVRGPEHPDTLTVRRDLASCRKDAGDVEGAAAALAELLPVYERVMGPEHPGTAAVRRMLA
ncbi:tetratricopeptide repeat protein [Streptomyces longwoodensis]|uniref:tetratricopeptide repeat protein n=1 Tax=Streptomyces longwoodensis TaxID=68231 RepID=UPI0033D0E9A9